MLLIFNVLRSTFGKLGWSFRKGPQDRIRDKDIVAWWSTFAYLLFRIVLPNGCKDDGFLASWGLSTLFLVPESFFFVFCYYSFLLIFAAKIRAFRWINGRWWRYDQVSLSRLSALLYRRQIPSCQVLCERFFPPFSILLYYLFASRA